MVSAYHSIHKTFPYFLHHTDISMNCLPTAFPHSYSSLSFPAAFLRSYSSLPFPAAFRLHLVSVQQLSGILSAPLPSVRLFFHCLWRKYSIENPYHKPGRIDPDTHGIIKLIVIYRWLIAYGLSILCICFLILLSIHLYSALYNS